MTKHRLIGRRLRNLVALFWRDTRGFLISTEQIVWLTLVVCAMVVGVAALREAVRSLFLDAAEALASRENGFVFLVDNDPSTGTTNPLVNRVVSNSQNPVFGFPDLQPLLPFRPVPTQPTKEGQTTP